MKLKSHSSTKKRIKVTGTGKFMFDKAAKRHLLTNKSRQAKKRDINGIIASRTQTRRLRKLLPYSA